MYKQNTPNSKFLYKILTIAHSLVAPGTSPLHLAPGVADSDQALHLASKVHLHNTDKVTELWEPHGPFRAAPVKPLSDLLHSSDWVRVALNQLLECDSLHVKGTGDLHWNKSRGVNHPAWKWTALFFKHISFSSEDRGQCVASHGAFWCSSSTTATTTVNSKCAQKINVRIWLLLTLTILLTLWKFTLISCFFSWRTSAGFVHAPVEKKWWGCALIVSFNTMNDNSMMPPPENKYKWQ